MPVDGRAFVAMRLSIKTEAALKAITVVFIIAMFQTAFLDYKSKFVIQFNLQQAIEKFLSTNGRYLPTGNHKLRV